MGKTTKPAKKTAKKALPRVNRAKLVIRTQAPTRAHEGVQSGAGKRPRFSLRTTADESVNFGQWLLDNMPKGFEFPSVERGESRPIPFQDEQVWPRRTPR